MAGIHTMFKQCPSWASFTWQVTCFQSIPTSCSCQAWWFCLPVSIQLDTLHYGKIKIQWANLTVWLVFEDSNLSKHFLFILKLKIHKLSQSVKSMCIFFFSTPSCTPIAKQYVINYDYLKIRNKKVQVKLHV